MSRILRTRHSRLDYASIQDYFVQSSPQNAAMIVGCWMKGCPC